MRTLLAVLGLIVPVLCAACSSDLAKPTRTEPGFVLPAAGDPTGTSLQVGDPFPKLQAVDLDGQGVVLDRRQWGARCTLIIFWFTRCGFCRLEMPQEVALAKEYEQAGLRVIGVNCDESVESAQETVETFGIPWLNLYEGPDRSISEALQVQAWPTLLLLDEEGRVVAGSSTLRSISGETLEDGNFRQINGLEWVLRKRLGEPRPRTAGK
ncbi:MAG: TlpA family protein disulfide reductase [Planctomycetes bacterium]|nr:TlpA family protein disulfide reductase [Planctomycetota bacterium]